jgi:hypothetical protein
MINAGRVPNRVGIAAIAGRAEAMGVRATKVAHAMAAVHVTKDVRAPMVRARMVAATKRVARRSHLAAHRTTRTRCPKVRSLTNSF